jgi:hypothetical protein
LIFYKDPVFKSLLDNSPANLYKFIDALGIDDRFIHYFHVGIPDIKLTITRVLEDMAQYRKKNLNR